MTVIISPDSVDENTIQIAILVVKSITVTVDGITYL